MFKFGVDPLKNYHDDISVEILLDKPIKIIADSYFFDIFFDYEEKCKHYIPLADRFDMLLNYWLNKIDSHSDNFFVFQLFDEYVAGFFNKGNNLYYGYTLQMQGWSIDQNCIDDVINEENIIFTTDYDLGLSFEQFLDDIKAFLKKK
ncbi:hypothetical protein [Bartonella sp. HY761]|uniref:hypothetical protein n=1 Tax=Bartonella sp. HY761 TaxID=2979330 RepID=UPI0022034F69|nr:hypothetical protein [Bartonella sp. HY761]UXN05163.1 hypothetical protein N6A79_07455 [Bartonella sp. HY761]